MSDTQYFFVKWTKDSEFEPACKDNHGWLALGLGMDSKAVPKNPWEVGPRILPPTPSEPAAPAGELAWIRLVQAHLNAVMPSIETDQDAATAIERAGKRIVALEREAEERAKDTARLDWREAHPRHGFGLNDDGTWNSGYGTSHATYRGALDAAMQPPQQDAAIEPPQAEGTAEGSAKR